MKSGKENSYLRFKRQQDWRHQSEALAKLPKNFKRIQRLKALRNFKKSKELKRSKHFRNMLRLQKLDHNSNNLKKFKNMKRIYQI